MIKFIKKYRHGLVIAIYALLYLITFNYLENRTVFSYQYHVIDTVFDELHTILRVLYRPISCYGFHIMVVTSMVLHLQEQQQERILSAGFQS